MSAWVIAKDSRFTLGTGEFIACAGQGGSMPPTIHLINERKDDMNEAFKTHGAFSWCELMTTDVAAAKEFYSALFGWTLEDMNATGMTYTVVKTGEEGIGGIMQVPPEVAGTPPHWGSYVTVDDVDATAKKAAELGAKICMPPTDISNVGRFCVLQDPQGAVISAITYMKM